MSVTFKFEGGREMERALLELSKEYGPRNSRVAFNPILKKAMQPVRQEIYDNTPVEYGDLKESTGITNRVRDVKRARRPLARGVKNQNIFASASAGWLKPQPHRRAASFQQRAVEYGSPTNPPRRVIRGALERNAKGVLEEVSRGWRTSLTRRRKYLSRRRARGKLQIK